jgi:cytochrome c5/outer membrane murein-binding lipoprotein Lpp
MRTVTDMKAALCLVYAIGAVSLLVACSTQNVMPPAQDAARAQTLQAFVDDLSQDLAKLSHAPDPAAQKQEMQAYWDMLQKQLQYIRDLPGVQHRDCRDWMALDPTVGGRPPLVSGMDCGLMSHDMGPAQTWSLPADLTPELFGIMMQRHLETLRAQVAAVVAEPDRARRLDLVRQHYETRYQDMQTIRGRSWMWAARSTAPDNGPQDLGASLLADYCSQCHAAPAPGLHTQAEWHGITRTMHDIIQTHAGVPPGGVRMPSPAEFNLIVDYLEAHARPAP